MEFNENLRKCQICDGPKTTSCYGAVVCASCRIFFIRTSRRMTIQQCKNENNCEIASARLKCTSCRFNKCLKMGMQCSEVGKRERCLKAVKNLSSFHYEERKSELSLCLLPAGLNNISRLQNVSSAKDFSEILFNFEEFTSNMNGKSASELPVDIDVNLVDVLMNPTCCASRESSAWDGRNEICFNKSYSYMHTYCRFATMNSDFLSSIPEFQGFSFDDKIKLYQKSFMTNITMSMLYVRWKLPYVPIKNSAVKRLDRFDFTPEEKKLFANFLYNVTTVYEKIIFPIFDEFSLSDQEWILLKIMSMLYSVENCTEKGAEMIASMKISYASILAKLIEEMHPNLSEEGKITRLRKILGTIKTITMLGGVGNQFHSSFIAANRAKLKGKLSYDIHIRQL